MIVCLDLRWLCSLCSAVHKSIRCQAAQFRQSPPSRAFGACSMLGFSELLGFTQLSWATHQHRLGVGVCIWTELGGGWRGGRFVTRSRLRRYMSGAACVKVLDLCFKTVARGVGKLPSAARSLGPGTIRTDAFTRTAGS